MKITIHNHDFVLTPEKALVWPARSILAVADLHLGREATFQKRGLWLPSGSEKSDLEKLHRLVEMHAIRHIVFLGDLIHSKKGAVPEVFEQLLHLQKSSGAELYAVGGNHDRHLSEVWNSYFSKNQMQDEFVFDNFIFAHEPPSKKIKGAFHWCGHLHPRVVLGRGGESIKLPAYIVEKTIGVLPAFSSLAAGQTCERKPGRTRYACLTDRVIPVD